MMTSFNNLVPIAMTDAAITIGSFDGVHVGHQKIIKTVIERAEKKSIPSIAFTFFPHPAVVLRSISEPYYLTTPAVREALLHSAGIDHCITLNFNREMANLDALSFLQGLKDRTGFSELVIGYDFALGKNREGSIDRLQYLAKQLGYNLTVVAPAQIPAGETVSSSRIRQLLSAGLVEEAEQLLGRRFSLSGTVIHGDGRGRTIDIPTANLQVDAQQLLPLNGVYATYAIYHDDAHLSVTNIGVKPTVTNVSYAVRTIETHILDRRMDLYDKPLRIEFIKYLRPEQKFPSFTALKNQIHQDIEATREAVKSK